MKQLLTIFLLYTLSLEAIDTYKLPDDIYLFENRLENELKKSLHVNIFSSNISYYNLKKMIKKALLKKSHFSIITHKVSTDISELVKFKKLHYFLSNQHSNVMNSILIFDDTTVCYFQGKLRSKTLKNSDIILTCSTKEDTIKHYRELFKMYQKKAQLYLLK